MKLENLIYEGEYSTENEIFGIDISNVTTRIDKISNGTLFVLQKSTRFDINKIISYVISQAPSAIICECDVVIDGGEIPVIRVESTRRILPYILSRFYVIDYSKMRFCAVTGTNGKTTTATMLKRILEYAGNKVGFIGTGKILIGNEALNEPIYSMTTPDPELLYPSIKKMQQSGCDFIVMEISSHALYFDKVSPIFFEVAIFTNLTEEHMDFHKNMEDYYNTKNRLFSRTKIGIFNKDDAYSRRALENALCKKESIGVLHSADVMAKDITLNGISGSTYTYHTNEGDFKVNLLLAGEYNVYNSMFAICAATALGVSKTEAKNAIESITFIDGRLEMIKDKVTVIIDYAHTEFAIKNVLKTINSSKNQGQKLITVFGCGGERDREKRPRMARVAEEYSDFTIVTTDNSRGERNISIIKDILKGFRDSSKRIVITSRKAAIEHAVMLASDNDIIALIGKGHERYNIDKRGYSSFDERDIVNKALKKREELSQNANKN